MSEQPAEAQQEGRIEQASPTRDSLPVIAPPTDEQIRAMHAHGRRMGDEMADQLAPLFILSEADMLFRHE